MSLAVIRTRCLVGVEALPVTVEVHLANGLPSFTLVGLADTEVKEARERVRSALLSSGLPFPHNKRITVNLAPADLPKDSGRFDLPIALGLLAAAGELDLQSLEGCEFAGELSLAGELRPVRGALAMALALRREPQRRVLVLPTASAQEAARAAGLEVRAAAHLMDVVQALRPGEGSVPLPAALPPAHQPLPGTAPDLREVRGQAGAKRALEIAAAGGHSLLLVGPPGTGKSMLAQRLPGLLPPMSEDEALDSAALQGLAGSGFKAADWGRRPVRSPHHSATAAALVGGGSPPRPGEISLAHGGVLFLDELPEFIRPALEALREPLESGRITISRAAHQAQFPARFQLVAAMNPCPCGWHGTRAGAGRECRCSPEMIARYQGRLSGPLLDRLDLQVEVPALPPAELLAAPSGEPTLLVAARVAQARLRQLTRQGCSNAELAAAALDEHCALAPTEQRWLESAAQRLGWSGRRLHRTLRVARSVADLDGEPRIGIEALAEAMQHQRVLSGA